jgi:hypothetical protein
VLVDELGHGVGQDAGDVDRKIERAAPKRFALQMMVPQAATCPSTVWSGEDALIVVADLVADDPIATGAGCIISDEAIRPTSKAAAPNSAADSRGH